ncbi:MAG: 4-hydroxy-tetrahydrodipicolinate reductase [Candidatus Eisenbacteria bacterium]|nr:4-hydroxy-tetrahydrodipicolinate reductase [Candidatus Eisenbacteria bacterium]
MIRVVLNGAAGRMGRAVTAAAVGATDLSIAACVDRTRGEGAGPWYTDLGAAVQPGDVVVDFSGPEGARQAAAVCAANGAALVTGSTGLAAADEAALADAARRVAVLRANNFSIGVAALRVALKAALAAVPGSWDVELVERHHRLKKDSPSGTAVTLVNDVRAARGLAPEAVKHGREGLVGPRPAAEIGVHAVRGGTWVGDHTVLLAGEGEWLELRHVAQDRAAFAHGALAAVRFLVTAAPGSYTLEDVLSGPGPRKH